MVIVEVEAVLAAEGLRNPTLPFLNQDPSYIRILMFQPQATIVADGTQVRAMDRPRMTSQMKGFLGQAQQLGVDLAICPEYSCTWDALLESIATGVFPAPGKIWALACESATSDELNTALTSLRQQLQVIFDDAVLHEAGNFVDVLCYLFVAQREDGSDVQVAVLQPKTHAMGGDHFEYSFLKPGNNLYRFANSGTQSNSLVGLICSDTLNPNFHSLLAQLHGDSLILHLQMNPNPSSPPFREYRNHFCSNVPRTTEILCLNWSHEIRIVVNGEAKTFITEPKTILFRDIKELTADDARIKENHAKGCYLTNWQQHRTAAFILSPDTHLFYFETSKSTLVGPATNAIRTGPRMVDLFVWNDVTSLWESQVSSADDRFKSYWFDPYPDLQSMLGPILPEYLDAERLIQLCVGRATDLEWAKWTKLPSFELADDDTSQRLTVCWSSAGVGLTYRQQCLSLFRGFAGIVANPAQFSNRLVAFKAAAFNVAYKSTPSTKEFRNFHLENGPSATAIYLGQTPANEKMSEIKKRTLKGLYNTESDTQLVALWYRDPAGQLRDFMDEDTPQINSNPHESPVAIDNTTL